ncbi:MAG: peptide chain release factor N(5)-glutamine methyltransferase [Hyphomicrobiaceae bacterium]
MPEGRRSLPEAIAGLTAELRAAGIETAALDARLLVLDAAAVDRLDLLRAPNRTLDGAAETRLADHRRRRLQREPVSRIVGHREFWSLGFEVTPDVLDPRPETEGLVEAALNIARAMDGDRRSLHIVDLGTGSGAILAALLTELPAARGIGVDRSWAALEVARRNTDRLGVGQRASFVQGNWLDAIGGPVDLVVANPPYLTRRELSEAEPEVRDFDPHLALDGGGDGLTAYRAIVAGWQRLGRPPVVLEIGAHQARSVIDLFRKLQLGLPDSAIRCIPDLAGRDRVVAVEPQFHFP